MKEIDRTPQCLGSWLMMRNFKKCLIIPNHSKCLTTRSWQIKGDIFSRNNNYKLVKAQLWLKRIKANKVYNLSSKGNRNFYKTRRKRYSQMKRNCTQRTPHPIDILLRLIKSQRKWSKSLLCRGCIINKWLSIKDLLKGKSRNKNKRCMTTRCWKIIHLNLIFRFQIRTLQAIQWFTEVILKTCCRETPA